MTAKDLWERQLDDFDPRRRREALAALWRDAREGGDALPEPGDDINLHAHTFFSYNAYGYSPSKFAWLARKAGLAVAGIVDFDVLDGADEFLEAGRLIGLKTCVSLELRVFVPGVRDARDQFAGRTGRLLSHGRRLSRAPSRIRFLTEMRAAAEQRTREMLLRVNAYLDPVADRFRARRGAADA